MTPCWRLAAVLAMICAIGAHAEMRVSQDDALKAVVEKTPPEYPPMARQLKIVGKVEVEISIDSDGAVSAVKIASGNPLLTAAVVGAVKKWKFAPFMENGAPAKAVASLGFDFKL